MRKKPHTALWETGRPDDEQLMFRGDWEQVVLAELVSASGPPLLSSDPTDRPVQRPRQVTDASETNGGFAEFSKQLAEFKALVDRSENWGRNRFQIMDNDPTGLLAAFTHDIAWSDIPMHVQEHAEDLFIDAVACALLGQTIEEVPELESALSELGGPGSTTVLGGGSASELSACFVNGYLVTAATMCDAHLPTQSHITPEVLPPTLALAEKLHASGSDMLVAFTIGLEVAARIGNALNPQALRQRGWHSPGVIGPFGGAAAAGRLAGLTRKEQMFAFGMAGSLAAGTLAQWGTVAVKFHQAHGSLSGLLSARLAHQGFVTCTDILTNSTGGILNVYSDGGKPEELTQDLGSVWRLDQISIRPWPVGAFMGSLVAALMDMLEKHVFKADDIDEVTVTLSDLVYGLHSSLPWHDAFLSRLSARYIAAVVLVDRACTLDQFDTERLAKKDVNMLASQRVVIVADSSAPDGRVAVSVRLNDGRVLETVSDSAPGHPESPLSRVALERKVRTCASAKPLVADTESVVQSLLNIRNCDNMASVVGGLRRAGEEERKS